MVDKQQLNVYLPAALIRRIKIAAIEAGLTYSAYVEQVLQEHLARTAEDDATQEAEPN